MSDLKGKTVLVTGATAGIGRETALGVAKLGAHVVLVGRNPEKTKRVADELKAATGNQHRRIAADVLDTQLEGPLR